MYIPHKRSWLPWVFGVGLLLVLILLFSLLRDILMPFIVAAVRAGRDPDAVYCGGGFGVHFESIGGHAAKTAS